ncbi:hypothetical protein DVK02_12385 [Halobellus sp. Atlit-31R]|nr:hypothetical protein DVK02_12385 [Halobellus sp. Atlit-31R]
MKSEASVETVTEEELFEVLANHRRRYVLRALTGTDAHDIGSLAETVAAWENGTTTDRISREDRKSVYTALQQLHLPKLHNAGLVVYDKSRGTVVPTPAKADVDVYLDVVRGNELPWHEYYLALSAVGAALLVVAWLDFFPFGMLPDVGWAGLVVLSFLVSSLFHYRSHEQARVGARDRPPE